MTHPKGRNPKPAERSVRVRSKRLDQIDEAKLALALSLMARRLLEERRAAQTTADGGREGGREVA